ncbi:hypothetical protein POL68_18625 [Stigmatella sp. ncwal1]|uniref:DUF5666 domain-containing protein n=1 Tax=Stigmatella ashevillensis TaxID=2995309 RepID=A0ABT5D9Y6_9BACT|nr:hypothetical protein [Stigmatella ashevillena]MDC0710498.1 hypothetical protein [Stigmatella ashevillena]
MKRFLGMAAVVGAAWWTGCQTDKAVAGYSSQTGSPARIAQNPNLSAGEGGLLVEGTVVEDTPDRLIIQDPEGLQRAIRIQNDTVYRQGEEGPLTSREYLEPGAVVRASFDYNNQERIAQEVIILENAQQPEPNAWPETPSPYPEDP